MINQMHDMGLSDPQFKEQGEFAVIFRCKETISSAYQRPQSELPINESVSVTKSNSSEGLNRKPVQLTLPHEDTPTIPKLTTEEELALDEDRR